MLVLIDFRLPAQVLDNVHAARFDLGPKRQKGLLLVHRGMRGVVNGYIEHRQVRCRLVDVRAVVHITAQELEALGLEPRKLRDIQPENLRLGEVVEPHPYRGKIRCFTVFGFAMLRPADLQTHLQEADFAVPERMEEQIVKLGIPVLVRTLV